MPVCSYCYRGVGRYDECFSWNEARGCSGITGPDDPKRLERKTEYKRMEANALLAEAAQIRRDAEEKASRLERQAAQYSEGI